VSTFDWQEFLQQYSRDILASDDCPDDLSPETVASQWLGYPGATDEQVRRAEDRLGVTLPPSYRAFLRVSNGWRCLKYSGLRLYSTEEVEWYSVRGRRSIDGWLYGAGDEDPEPLFVPDTAYFAYRDDPIGMYFAYYPTTLHISAEGDCDVYLLNPRIVTRDGEWEAWHMMDEASRFRTFPELLLLETLVEPDGSGPGREVPAPWPNKPVEAYIDALRSPDDGVRRQAATALGFLADQRAVEPLVRTLTKDPNPGVRGNAARALGSVDDVRAVEPLINALAAEPSGSVRSYIVHALSMLRDPRALKPLIRALEDPDGNVRLQASWAHVWSRHEWPRESEEN